MTRLLTLGADPDPLSVKINPAEGFDWYLDYREGGVAAAWPSAPVVILGPVSAPVATLVATLGPDDTPQADARATWSAAPGDLAGFTSDVEARLRVGGVTWWKGMATCLS